MAGGWRQSEPVSDDREEPKPRPKPTIAPRPQELRKNEDRSGRFNEGAHVPGDRGRDGLNRPSEPSTGPGEQDGPPSRQRDR